MPKCRRRFQAQHGFSLVELLVVIVIFSILAAIVVFAVTGITDKGRQRPVRRCPGAGSR